MRATAPARHRLLSVPPRLPLAVAAAMAAAALTPSLIPKAVLVQGVVAGIAAVVGYAVVVLLRWLSAPLWRRLPDPVRRWGGWVALAVAAGGLLLSTWRANDWHRDLALSVGLTDPPQTGPVGVLLVAGLVLVVTVGVARILRVLTGWTARWLARVLPWLAAVALAVMVVTGGTGLVVWYLVEGRVLASVDDSFRLLNRESSPEQAAPVDPLRSGGPGSLMGWSTLGRQGRAFVSLPVDGSLVERPVRVYAGVDSAADLAARADLVVQELDRTGGFDRGVLCLVVPTGTGWVDPDAVTALEGLWAGDSAVASMQYSYLPSAMSLVADRSRVEDAARALLGAVLRRLDAAPAGSRPTLVLYGESLGSRGAEAALASVPGAREAVDAALLVGPVGSNPVWSELVSRRDPGSPLLAPVIDGGRSVRFWPGPEMPAHQRAGQPWPESAAGPRTLYLQHPSDPVVWWSPSLIWSEPAWVEERETATRAPPLDWRPVVTFWQVTGDLAFAAEVPAGHGHNYGAELSRAWAAVAPPGAG
jgi:uncharacterized membrane protein